MIDVGTAGQSQVREMYLLKRTSNHRLVADRTLQYVNTNMDTTVLRGPIGLTLKGYKFYHPANALFLSEKRSGQLSGHSSPDQWYTQRDRTGRDLWRWQIFDSEADIRLTATFWSEEDEFLVKESFMLVVERDQAYGPFTAKLVNLHCSGPLTPADAARLKEEHWDATPGLKSQSKIRVEVEDKKKASFFKMASIPKELEIIAMIAEESGKVSRWMHKRYVLCFCIASHYECNGTHTEVSVLK